MDALKVAEAARRIENNERAIKWLMSYGENPFSLSVHAPQSLRNDAGQSALTKLLTNDASKTAVAAIDICRNEIEADKRIILDQLNTDGT